jgi:hypothetical protein
MNWGMATDTKLKDYILYKYKERIKEKRTHYMLSIISSGNRGCCSSTVPICKPPLLPIYFLSYSFLANILLISFISALLPVAMQFKA